MVDGAIETPWDRRVFGIDTYEITTVTDERLERLSQKPGHFSVRVPPLFPKRILHETGFYYCDTLIEPYCQKKHFKDFHDDRAEAGRNLDPDQAVPFCRKAFQYDRFHRDFNLDKAKADERYEQWMRAIAQKGALIGLWFEKKLAGFFACEGSQIRLHALGPDFRGKGLAKYLWSAACRQLFAEGYEELSSSVSAANLAIVNLYRSLGFSFRHPVDIYHKYNPPRL
ncbi:GNAT family N-acetyltransferase [Camelliibacillus cellulosilyticus]|uniref:GNAT family N-acetyltransferase n=1 Tax=Camelliibacillus cellulosilyticus TaxID=2174486 RepID=A0ABV9GNJ2_9BACL